MRHGLQSNAHARVEPRVAIKRTVAPRERILEVADDLFYRYGIRSVGIDRIIAESDVAKMTFYKHFPSKSNLVATYLSQRRVQWREVLEKILLLEVPAMNRVLAIFDAVDTICHTPKFEGCPFIKAMAEFGRDHDEAEIQSQISLHFNETNAMISGLIKKSGLPEDLTQVIASLIFGSLIVTHATGRADVAQINKRAVRSLMMNYQAELRACNIPN